MELGGVPWKANSFKKGLEMTVKKGRGNPEEVFYYLHKEGPTSF